MKNDGCLGAMNSPENQDSLDFACLRVSEMKKTRASEVRCYDNYRSRRLYILILEMKRCGDGENPVKDAQWIVPGMSPGSTSDITCRSEGVV